MIKSLKNFLILAAVAAVLALLPACAPAMTTERRPLPRQPS